MSQPDRELTVEELDEVAGGAYCPPEDEELNFYCPRVNAEACNTDCSAALAMDSAAA